jgi:hypothetical protein
LSERAAFLNSVVPSDAMIGFGPEPLANLMRTIPPEIPAVEAEAG